MAATRSIPFLGYCTATRQWTPLANLASPGSTSLHSGQQPPAGSDNFTVLTYNVFSGSASSSVPHAGQRTKAILSILRKAKADVMALQEVSIPFERSLRHERWFREKWVLTSLQDFFRMSTNGASGLVNARNEDDGCILAIRRCLLEENCQHAIAMRLIGAQGKVLISAHTQSGISIATSHFESMAENAQTRIRQYHQTCDFLSESESAVLLGDFNHSNYHELSGLFARKLLDVTLPTRTSSDGPDWQLRSSATFGLLFPFFDGSQERRKPRRLDLVMARNVQIIKSWTAGGKPLEIEKRKEGQREAKRFKLKCRSGKDRFCYPSDHLAVLADISTTTAKEGT